MNAKLIDDLDNVIVAIYEMKEGEQAQYVTSAGKEECLRVREAIPLFHKIARCELSENDKIIKYGHCIGIAATHIAKGDHVHVHNVKNVKES